MELIDRAALGVGRCDPEVMRERAYAAGWNGLLGILNNAPTIDAVPVVRCRNCKHWLPRQGCSGCHHRSGLWEPQEDDYCSLGERKEDEYGTD